MSWHLAGLRLSSLLVDAGRSDAGVNRLPIIVGGNQLAHALMPALLAAVIVWPAGERAGAAASVLAWIGLEVYQVAAAIAAARSRGERAGRAELVRNSLRDLACYVAGMVFWLTSRRPDDPGAAALAALSLAALVLGIALLQGRAPEENPAR